MNRCHSIETLLSSLVVLAALAGGVYGQSDVGGAADVPPDPLDAATREFVNSKVQPLLQARCYECHGPDVKEPRGGLRLDSRASMLTGGDSGAALVPGDPRASLLIDAINWRGDFEMPPTSKLPAGEIAILSQWVQRGAPWPLQDTTSDVSATKDEFPLQQRKSSHWAWQPLHRPVPPQVTDRDWPASDIDRFILDHLQRQQLGPAPPAERQVLIRRAYFDLIGLPPSPEQIQAFLQDSRPLDQAFADVVDRLLASPQFGQRWARHWLDVVRYAESRGHEFDHPAANAYQYRDYVIRALNQDLPYDRFVVEQIAGDLLDVPRLHPRHGFNESVIGTGFWYLGDWIHSPTDIRQDEADRIDNMIDTLGRALMGMTIACARCHDHKFDAISTRDYYALAGFAQSTRYRQVRFDAIEQNRRIAAQLNELDDEYQRRIRQQLASAWQTSLQRFDISLLAAREVLQGQPVEQVATRSSVHVDRLARIVDHLRQVRTQVDDPLHVWALCCFEDNSSDELVWRETIQGVATRWNLQHAADQQRWNNLRVVADYTRCQPADWSQDGFAFGRGPVLPGLVGIDDSTRPPQLFMQTHGAARRDPAWRGLGLVDGTEADAGALGGVPRSGQTLCTPTFTIETGKIHYLVRGGAKVQAVVDSHRLVAGPLHGSLIQSIPGSSAPRWFTHSLERYVGHRTHIEFVPADDGPLEVYLVVDSKDVPLDPVEVKPVIVQLAESDQPPSAYEGSPKPSANSVQTCLRDRLLAVSNRLSNDNEALPWTTEQAELGDWMVRHRDLLLDEREQTELIELVEQYLARRKELSDGIMRRSRTAIAAWDGTAEDETLLIRGRASNPGPLVPRRFLEAVAGPNPPRYESGSGRLALAQQLIDERTNPLIARVMANRIWHHLFGRGIVASTDNFGVLGTPPSHPELLDYLATQFVEHDWSIKNLIRQMMLSRVYQMSSRPDDEQAESTDPDNIWLHRMPVRRLEGEAIRDTMLALSGRLDTRCEGPSVPVYLTDFMTGRGRPSSGPLDGDGRRSIYISIRRNFLSPMMLAFDMPIPSQPVGCRNVSNVPAQALILMNDPFVKQQAERWAQRMLLEVPDSADERIQRMYAWAYGRGPDESELVASLEFLQSQATMLGVPGDRWQQDARVWADLAHVLWNVKEFIYID